MANKQRPGREKKTAATKGKGKKQGVDTKAIAPTAPRERGSTEAK